METESTTAFWLEKIKTTWQAEARRAALMDLRKKVAGLLATPEWFDEIGLGVGPDPRRTDSQYAAAQRMVEVRAAVLAEIDRMLRE